jgi:phosphate acetyltransferase
VLSEGDLSRRIKEVAVFAQGIPGGLRMLTEGRLVVVPGDRHDVVMGLPIDDLERIEGVVNSIADALEASWLESLRSSSRSRRLSPAAFRFQLVEHARAADACVVLPEGTESRIVQAAVACAERGIARSVLLGPPDQVAGLARSLGLRLPPASP